MLAESRQCSWIILLHVELGCGRPDGWYFLPFVEWANTQSHHPYHLAFLCQLESSTNNCLHSRRFERFWRLYDNKLLTLRQFLIPVRQNSVLESDPAGSLRLTIIPSYSVELFSKMTGMPERSPTVTRAPPTEAVEPALIENARFAVARPA